MKIRTYSELRRFRTFEDRYEYLRLQGKVGESTFGFDRIFNQMFYKSGEWLALRDDVIIRDNGCDLGIKGREIQKGLFIHHMNPISIEDIKSHSDWLLNPDFLITTILSTHNAIHYGNKDLLVLDPIVRTRNDTCPWKH
jgi:hypothetical protein